MATQLTDAVVAKMKADFPALAINQIAGKYGVSWYVANRAVRGNGPRVLHAGKKRAHPPKVRPGYSQLNGAGDTVTIPRRLLEALVSSLSAEIRAALKAALREGGE
jgi:hypothetical protein